MPIPNYLLAEPELGRREDRMIDEAGEFAMTAAGTLRQFAALQRRVRSVTMEIVLPC